MPRLYSSLLLSLLIASSASAVTMDWTPIGDPGNACDPQGTFQGQPVCFGAVGYSYSIGTYEVTNAQYAEFLNAKASSSDSLGLYNPEMGTHFAGGITRTGSEPGPFTYTTITGQEIMPVNFVSFYDALRFANWMNNGQGSGDTETGTYTITSQGISDNSITRNAGTTIFLPSEDEWYKAAYYSALATSYFDYPAGSDTQTACSAPTAAANSANCNYAVGDVTIMGSYTGSASPYGTFDQGGNVFEWNETIISSFRRGSRGGSFNAVPLHLAASIRGYDYPAPESSFFGFRVAMIPEPGTGLLVIAGMLGLGGWRRVRA